MRPYRNIPFIAVSLAALCICAVSCKHDKDDDTTSYSYFEGDLSFDIPGYVQKGEVYRLMPEGDLRRADDDDSEDSYGLVWTIDLRSVSDTVRYEGEDASSNDGSMIYSIPDTLCDISVTLKAYASGYSATSVSKTVIVIDPSEEDGSLTGRTFPDGIQSFTDSRDSRSYRYVSLGGTDWMAENLAWDGAGHSFDEAEVMDELVGRFYTWDEAVSACPSGWRLPSNQDWTALARTVTGVQYDDDLAALEGLAGSLMVPEAYINQYRMWDYQPAFDITNSTSLSILPTGYATIADGVWTFSGFTYYAAFWTSDERDADEGYYRLIYASQPAVSVGAAAKEYFATVVRCVR